MATVEFESEKDTDEAMRKNKSFIGKFAAHTSKMDVFSQVKCICLSVTLLCSQFGNKILCRTKENIFIQSEERIGTRSTWKRKG